MTLHNIKTFEERLRDIIHSPQHRWTKIDVPEEVYIIYKSNVRNLSTAYWPLEFTFDDKSIRILFEDYFELQILNYQPRIPAWVKTFKEVLHKVTLYTLKG